MKKFVFEKNRTGEKKRPGIFFLFSGDTIVYINKSCDVYSSVKNHKDKNYDSWNYIACPSEDQDALVEDLILEHTPVHNGPLRTNVKWVSKTRAKNKYGFSKTDFNRHVKNGNFSNIRYFGDVYVLTSEFDSIRLMPEI